MPELVKCLVEPGVFSSEWAVKLEAKEGPVSFFVDKSLVEPSGTPQIGRPVPGSVKVTVLEENPDFALIRLPAQSSGTSSVWVHRSRLVGKRP